MQRVYHSTIMNFRATERLGIQSHQYNRNSIGYVEAGTKKVYKGDEYIEITAGEVYFMPSGIHYTEEIPDQSSAYSEITFSFNNDTLSRAIESLAATIDGNPSEMNDHVCGNCEAHIVVYPQWESLKAFYSGVSIYIKAGVFAENQTSENIKLIELIYLMLSHPDCCIKRHIFKCYDSYKQDIEHIVRNNIFNDLSVSDLAESCNRSLTTFKSEFKDKFGTTPHKWIIAQRLMHARIQLISTSKTIAMIGKQAKFQNTSHFIRLFRKEFGMTPVAYRNMHTQNATATPTRHIE